MKAHVVFVGCAALLLAACDEVPNGGAGTGPTFLQLPENVIEVAAPNQDLNAVRIDPIDGCYVYRHIGPVETTYLPLRTKRGNPICTRAAEEAATS